MRQIKFRAWLLDRNDPNQILDEDGEATVYSMTYDLAFEEYAPINELLASVEHLMQFTGLLDKNSKDIYEGDVVTTEWELERKKVTGKIVWHEGFCGWAIESDEMQYRFSATAQAMRKVIGNIYENPELLEVKP